MALNLGQGLLLKGSRRRARPLDVDGPCLLIVHASQPALVQQKPRLIAGDLRARGYIFG